jgi:hypothetical protein
MVKAPPARVGRRRVRAVSLSASLVGNTD